ncbi:MAG: hypothetical protein GX760_00180 [Erysipelothrix sp.]|nr:hypothetical protein [Erysipelothrix sp.]
MNRNNHKKKELKENCDGHTNKKQEISYSDFILGKEFMENEGQYYIEAQEDHQVLYGLVLNRTNYGAEVTSEIQNLGCFDELEDACEVFLHMMKGAMMHGKSKEILFKRDSLNENIFRRGYSVLTQSGITRIVIFELAFYLR